MFDLMKKNPVETYIIAVLIIFVLFIVSMIVGIEITK